MSGPVYHFVGRSDVVFGIGCSFTKHGMCMNIPPGKTMIQATNDPGDINKDYNIDYPIVGDAKLVLRQMIDACRDIVGQTRQRDGTTAREIKANREAWLVEWRPKLTDSQAPINPYRVISDFMQAIPPGDAIVTHDSGSPRDQIIPFYRSEGSRSYLGWGKSHGLGTGLGLTIGAKLAKPEKVCVNFMGDAAFGMTGLDFETAVRSRLPIITVVLNNSTMAAETRMMAASHELYNTRDLGGNYADMGRAMGGYAERIEDPAAVIPAFQRARRVTEQEGKAVLLEFITSSETAASHRRAF
jgi:acetolactate synthase-1/2/3 large subunit